MSSVGISLGFMASRSRFLYPEEFLVQLQLHEKYELSCFGTSVMVESWESLRNLRLVMRILSAYQPNSQSVTF